jgi:hypothetical protein
MSALNKTTVQNTEAAEATKLANFHVEVVVGQMEYPKNHAFSAA